MLCTFIHIVNETAGISLKITIKYVWGIGFKGLVLGFCSCENLLEPSRTGLDLFKTKLTVPNLERNKYSSNVYNNSTSYI